MLPITNKLHFFYFTLVTCIILFNNNALAQGKWTAGYIVTAKGDTLIGKIAYVEKPRSPRSILFRNEKGDKKRYIPAQINSFKIHTLFQDIYFKSFSAAIDISPTDLAGIDNSPNPKLEKCTFFAQLLIAGKKSLYTFTDTIVNKKHFLIETADGEITDLIYKHYYHDESRTLPMYNEEYKKQLEKFYSDCSFTGNKKINDAQYTAKSLVSLAKDYNKCYLQESGYEYKREKAKAVFGVDIGADKTTLRMNGGSYTGISFTPSYSLNTGIFLNCILPHTEKRWSIYNELMFTNYKMNSGTYYPNYPYTPITATATLDITYLKLVTAVRYQYSNYRVKPFLQFGMVNGYAISATDNALVHENGLPNKTEQFIPFRNYEQSFFGGIGLSYKKYEAEIRYQHGNGFSDLTEASEPVSTSTTYLLFLIKYAFN